MYHHIVLSERKVHVVDVARVDIPRNWKECDFPRSLTNAVADHGELETVHEVKRRTRVKLQHLLFLEANSDKNCTGKTSQRA
jgi:hypothetical protein